jgi:hypothetical protein
MIVPLVVSSPACFPNGKVGIVDSDLSHLEPVSAHNSAGYYPVAVAAVTIVPKRQAAAC